MFVTDMVTILSYLSPFIRLTGVDGPWLRQKLGIVVSIKTGPVAELLLWQQHNRGCFVFCYKHFWCWVSETLLQNFQRYCSFSILQF